MLFVLCFSVPTETLEDRFSISFNKQRKFTDYNKCCGYINKPKLNSTPFLTGHSKPISLAHRNMPPKRFGRSLKTRPNSKFPQSYQQLLAVRYRNISHLLQLQNTSAPQNIPTFSCKYKLNHHCGKYFDGWREYNCFTAIFGKQYPGLRKRWPGMANTGFLSATDTRLLEEVKNSKRSYISQHNNCVEKAKKRSSKCLPPLKTKCTDSSIVAAKVIRLRMEGLQDLLLKEPHIKVIHYFRDPRGIENSRSAGMKRKKEGMIKDAKLLCSRMLQDIQIRKKLEEKYPQSFMVLMYEDLANNPLREAERLYNFIGHKLLNQVKDWLELNTHSKARWADKKPLGTSRSNSSSTAIQWMTKLSLDTKLKLTQICKDVLVELGIPSEEEHLQSIALNQSMPSLYTI